MTGDTDGFVELSCKMGRKKGSQEYSGRGTGRKGSNVTRGYPHRLEEFDMVTLSLSLKSTFVG